MAEGNSRPVLINIARYLRPQLSTAVAWDTLLVLDTTAAHVRTVARITGKNTSSEFYTLRTKK